MVQVRRHPGIDALRGLAIVSMVAAHLAWRTLTPPAPLTLRLFGSLAAPLFVALAGLMVAQSQTRNRYSVRHYLDRSVMLLAVAALLDVLVWGLVPGVGFDILYLLAVALPVSALFCRLDPNWQLGVLFAWPVLSELLRHGMGYPAEMLLLTTPADLAHHAPAILHQWFVSGWFPLFPWLYFAFLGVWLFQSWERNAGGFFQRLPGIGASVIAVGILYGWLVPTPFTMRGVCQELFYPPSAAFVGIATGLILLLFRSLDERWLTENWPLIRLGRHALSLYVLHLLVIEWFLAPHFHGLEITSFAVIYAGLLVGLLGLTKLVEAGTAAMRQRRDSPRPSPPTVPRATTSAADPAGELRADSTRPAGRRTGSRSRPT